MTINYLGEHQMPEGVAQIFNLPYRRFSICGALEAVLRLPTASRRYGRLQICATGLSGRLCV